MTQGRRKANRVHAVEQAAMVWGLIDEDVTEEHLAAFIETGEFNATPDAMPYNPAVMAEIAKHWK